MKKNIFVLGMLVMTLTLGFVFIGCDNGNNDPGDITAPTLSLQAVAQYGDTVDGTTAKVVFTSNEAGTCYVMVLTSATAAPDTSTLAGSALTGTVTANTATTVNITDLTKDLEHKAYVTVKDAAGNYSAVWSSDSFTPTKAASVVNPFVGTWIADNPPYGLTAAKSEATDTEWEAFVKSPYFGDGNWVSVCSGTYTYAGYPAIWVVGTTTQYSTLKIGDVGIATINGDGKLVVFNFIDPNANGTYTKQP